MLGKPDVTPPLLHAVKHPLVVPIVARVTSRASRAGAKRADPRGSLCAAGARLAEEVGYGLDVVLEGRVTVNRGDNPGADQVTDGHVPAGGAAVTGVAGGLAWREKSRVKESG